MVRVELVEVERIIINSSVIKSVVALMAIKLEEPQLRHQHAWTFHCLWTDSRTLS